MKIKIPIIILGICSLVIGCASGAKFTKMMPEEKDLERYRYDEGVKNRITITTVSGGKKTNPAWKSEISNKEFEQAVKQTLSKKGLYNEGGNLKLSIELVKVDQPLIGFNMTVTTHVNYIIINANNDEVVLNETVVASFTATMADSVYGVERLKMANEGAGRKNIESFLEKLMDLNIKKDIYEVVILIH